MMENRELIEIKRYKSEDLDQILTLFYDTVHTVCTKDYTEGQVKAWATGQVDEQAGNRSFLDHDTIVAWNGEKIVGFADMDATGYLDRLYVHKDYQRWKIASSLCDILEGRAGHMTIETHASITARPFFERRGYLMIKPQQVLCNGEYLTNYIMKKECDRKV